MRSTLKLSVAGALAALLAATAGPASADVTVTTTVNKEKDVFLDIDVFKDKFVFVDVDFVHDLESAAEALALANVENTGNVVDRSGRSTLTGPGEDDLGGDDYGIDLDSRIQASVIGNTGIVGLNQDAGNMVNQGNIVDVAAVSPDADAAPAFTDSESAIDQVNTANTVVHIGDIVAPDDPERDKVAQTAGSVNDNSGVVGVNQNVGNMNNQTNGLAVAVGSGAVLALSEADLGQENTGNTVTEFETVKLDTTVNSYNGNSGVISGNQSAGNMNNQANAVAFSAQTTSVSLSVPGTPSSGGNGTL